MMKDSWRKQYGTWFHSIEAAASPIDEARFDRATPLALVALVERIERIADLLEGVIEGNDYLHISIKEADQR